MDFLFQPLQLLSCPFLQYIHNLPEGSITLELGAGHGHVTWKVPLAFSKSAKHYVNDLSEGALRWNKSYMKLPQAIASQVIFDCGDCFTILERHPELRGKVNAVMAQNLEHFFNPEQHQRFLALLSELLVEGGRAFLCSHTHQFQIHPRDAVANLYFERRAMGDVYPAFCQVTRCMFSPEANPRLSFDVNAPLRMLRDLKRQAMEGGDRFVLVREQLDVVEKLGGIDFLTLTEFADVIRPDDKSMYFQHFMLTREPLPFWVPFGDQDTKVLISLVRLQQNTFSPSVYRAAVQACGKPLNVLDTFFVTEKGAKAEEWSYGTVSHAAAIVEKRTSPVLPTS